MNKTLVQGYVNAIRMINADTVENTKRVNNLITELQKVLGCKG